MRWSSGPGAIPWGRCCFAGSGYPTRVSEKKNDDHKPDLDQERRDIAELQDKLDAEAEGEGLAAEAGRAEENGISEG